MLSLKVTSTVTWLSLVRVGMKLIAVTCGPTVSITRLVNWDEVAVCPFSADVTVAVQVPSARVGSVMVFEVASTASMVAVTSVAPTLDAVTVMLVPTVRPDRLSVGVLSLVTLSEVEVPVSEAVARVGALGVGIDTAVLVAAELELAALPTPLLAVI